MLQVHEENSNTICTNMQMIQQPNTHTIASYNIPKTVTGMSFNLY